MSCTARLASRAAAERDRTGAERGRTGAERGAGIARRMPARRAASRKRQDRREGPLPERRSRRPGTTVMSFGRRARLDVDRGTAPLLARALSGDRWLRQPGIALDLEPACRSPRRPRAARRRAPPRHPPRPGRSSPGATGCRPRRSAHLVAAASTRAGPPPAHPAKLRRPRGFAPTHEGHDPRPSGTTTAIANRRRAVRCTRTLGTGLQGLRRRSHAAGSRGLAVIGRRALPARGRRPFGKGRPLPDPRRPDEARNVPNLRALNRT